jgi:lipoate-protein ligase A
MNSARLILDKHGGAMNMAIDEALLLSAPRSGATLRFYQWEEPTLSLGYFQSGAERSRHEASRNCPVVRRSTGGGAILHHHELTYSFVAPLDIVSQLGAAQSDREERPSPQRLYYAFHDSLVRALEDLDVKASLCSAGSLQQIDGEPFLCFQRRADGDVLIGTEKVCGSAQRRQKSAVLQHGSVLLRRSISAPELPGISDLAAKDISFEALAQCWCPQLAERLNLDLQPGSLDNLEQADSERLSEDRFGTDAWSLRR